MLRELKNWLVWKDRPHMCYQKCWKVEKNRSVWVCFFPFTIFIFLVICVDQTHGSHHLDNFTRFPVFCHQCLLFHSSFNAAARDTLLKFSSESDSHHHQCLLLREGSPGPKHTLLTTTWKSTYFSVFIFQCAYSDLMNYAIDNNETSSAANVPLHLKVYSP